MAFLLDGMLGKLATKLRILGFDTDYDKESSDADLLEKAAAQGRILVSSDRELSQNARLRHLETILLRSDNEEDRLLELCEKAGIPSLDLSKPSRCSICNALLAETGERDAYGRLLYRCPNCRKIYWRGSHWKKLVPLFEKINSSLLSSNNETG